MSCLALSRSGKYLASGQITYMGFTADIIIWDLETKQLLHRMALHKVGTVGGVQGAGAGLAGGAGACTRTGSARAAAQVLCSVPNQGSAHVSQVKVQALDFSPDERFLASLGGQDDNALVGPVACAQWGQTQGQRRMQRRYHATQLA